MSATTRYPYPAAARRDRSARSRRRPSRRRPAPGRPTSSSTWSSIAWCAGAARLEEILVVTFTERAAAELRRRIRALVANVLARSARRPARPRRPGLDDRRGGPRAGSRTRPRRSTSRRSRPSTPSATAILVEHAFAGGRLLAQTQVESREAFSLAFAEDAPRAARHGPGACPLPRGLARSEHRRQARGAAVQGAPAPLRLGDDVRARRALARAARAFLGSRPRRSIEATVAPRDQALRSAEGGDRAAQAAARGGALASAPTTGLLPPRSLARDRRAWSKDKKVFAFLEDPRASARARPTRRRR